jgi:hypothetical protein
VLVDEPARYESLLAHGFVLGGGEKYVVDVVAKESLRSVLAGESMLESMRAESSSSKILEVGLDSRSGRSAERWGRSKEWLLLAILSEFGGWALPYTGGGSGMLVWLASAQGTGNDMAV